MKWLKENWRLWTLNLFGETVLASLVWQSAIVGRTDLNFDPMLVDSGKWAIRFLLFSLAMTPLNTLLGWRNAIKLRKPAGLWAFGFTLGHFGLNIFGNWENWMLAPIPDYIAALGVIGLAILTPMAATSTRWAMKRLGKWWKRLHRLVYGAGVIAILHALLESPSKRVAPHDPQAGNEVILYLVILAVLLAARVPVVRSTLANLRNNRGVRKATIIESSPDS